MLSKVANDMFGNETLGSDQSAGGSLHLRRADRQVRWILIVDERSRRREDASRTI
jgi:hypothetical protein